MYQVLSLGRRFFSSRTQGEEAETAPPPPPKKKREEKQRFATIDDLELRELVEGSQEQCPQNLQL